MEAEIVYNKIREKIIKDSCNELQTVIDEKLWPGEIPTTIQVEGSQGTVIKLKVDCKI